MRRKCRLLLVCLMAAMLASSCALLPQEEEVRSSPVVAQYTRPEYKTAQVERGDLIETARVNCNYVPVQTASLSFALDGEYIDRYFVEAGDHVQAGQLLGQLQLGDLEQRIENIHSEIEVLKLKMQYQRDLFALEEKRLAITTEGLTPAEKALAYQKKQDEYEAVLHALADSLTLQELSLQTLNTELEKRRIRAPFEGTVTRVERLRDGDRSEFGSAVMTLVDSTRSIFRASTEYWDRFHAGDEVVVTVRKVDYQAVVVDEGELGLAPQQRTVGRRGYVYFALTQPAVELKDGDNGSVAIVLAQLHDVLYVPFKAVSAAEGQPIVYYLREDGMKAYKPVETGAEINGYVEIISGLEEGETIVVK